MLTDPLVACAALANRNAQFALKYWGALALTVMGITLLLWKGEGDSGNAPQDAYNITYFFFVWQPGEHFYY